MVDIAAMLPRLEDKVTVVTGAGQGLGQVTAELFSKLGAIVVILDLNSERARSVAENITARGAEALVVIGDVSDDQFVASTARAVQARYGRCDVLVNNAAINSYGPLEDFPVEEWDRVTAVNLRGPFLCLQEFGRMMLAQGTGSVVNIASIAASAPSPLGGAYSASKAGLVMLTRLAAVEWGLYGIRVNAVRAGLMNTPMADRFNDDPAARRMRDSMVPIGGVCDPIDVASVIAFLASDASSYVTGESIEVDGGLMQTFISHIPRPGVAHTN